MHTSCIANCDHILLLNGCCLYCIVTEEVKFCLLVGYWAACLVIYWVEGRLSAT